MVCPGAFMIVLTKQNARRICIQERRGHVTFNQSKYTGPSVQLRWWGLSTVTQILHREIDGNSSRTPRSHHTLINTIKWGGRNVSLPLMKLRIEVRSENRKLPKVFLQPTFQPSLSKSEAPLRNGIPFESQSCIWWNTTPSKWERRFLLLRHSWTAFWTHSCCWNRGRVVAPRRGAALLP